MLLFCCQKTGESEKIASEIRNVQHRPTNSRLSL